MNLEELFEENKKFEDSHGDRFQSHLGELITRERKLLVVESGVSHGVSTYFILRAFDQLGEGHLHSIDPDPKLSLEHQKWTLWQKTSYEAMSQIYEQTGSWDLFLHDSDHGPHCQSFEYELAWNFLKPDGILITDDPIWDQPPHHAWKNFIERHALEEHVLNYARFVRKNSEEPVRRSEIQAAHFAAGKLADRASKEYEALRRR